MYLGILGVSGLAFACSTEFIPELNEKMRLVPFTADFRFTMTLVMIVDYVGCYVIEKGLKAAFSDYKPKDIAIRRPDQLAREEERKAKEKAEALQRQKEEDEQKNREKVEAAERKLAELRERWGIRQ